MPSYLLVSTADRGTLAATFSFVGAPMGEARGNGAAFGLGIAGLVLGIMAMPVAWIPFLGCAALPLGGLGLVLAGIGLVLALATGDPRKGGIGMPIAGAIVSATAIAVFLLSTTLAVGVLDAAAKQAEAERAARQQQQGDTRQTRPYNLPQVEADR